MDLINHYFPRLTQVVAPIADNGLEVIKETVIPLTGKVALTYAAMKGLSTAPNFVNFWGLAALANVLNRSFPRPVLQQNSFIARSAYRIDHQITGLMMIGVMCEMVYQHPKIFHALGMGDLFMLIASERSLEDKVLLGFRFILLLFFARLMGAIMHGMYDLGEQLYEGKINLAA